MSINIQANEAILLMSKKIVAHDVITIRTARSGEDPPLIISLPRAIVKAAKYKKGDKIQVYTDGEKTYLERLAEPKI